MTTQHVNGLLHLDIGLLRPHPANSSIYGEEEIDESFLDSIREFGIRDAITINQSNVILSGHRRWVAARRIGITAVPVKVCCTQDWLEDKQILLDCNLQRVKTNEQLAREAMARFEIEGEKARRRMAEAGASGGVASGVSRRGEVKGQERVPDPSTRDTGQARKKTGQARDKVGEALGISGRQAEKAAAVAKKIDELKQSGEEERAEEIRKTLNEQSVGAAFRMLDPGRDRATSADGKPASDEPRPVLEPTEKVVIDDCFTYASLCSGIEGAGEACRDLGWTPLFFAEIDPFCVQILRGHYPGVPNLGDINGVTRERINQCAGMQEWTCSLPERRASRFPSTVCDWVWWTSVESLPSSFFESFRSASLAGLFGKTSPAFSRSTEEGRLVPSSEGWGNAGMGTPGACLTLATSECPSVADVCSLSDILEEDSEVPSSYSLTPQQLSRMRDRLLRYKGSIPEDVAWMFGGGPGTQRPSLEGT